MDGLRDELFSGAAFARNQHGAVRGAHDFDHLEELLHLLALSDEISHTVDFLELTLQVSVFFTQPPVLERVVHDEFQLFHEVFGFEDVIVGAHFQRLDRGFSTGKGGQQDELAVEAGAAELAQKIDACHVGHLDVGDDEIELRRLDLCEGFLSA